MHEERSRRMKKWAVAIGAGVVAAVVTAPGSTAIAQSQRFPDVAADHYAYEAVEWAAQAGVTLGYSDGTFRPQQPLAKSHAVVFMERYYNEILKADQSDDFTRADMMVLLKTINDGTLRSTGSTGAETFKAIAAGGRHSCGLRTDDTVSCWGLDDSGQRDTPPGTFKAITARGSHTCGLRTDGVAECWGRLRTKTAAPADTAG